MASTLSAAGAKKPLSSPSSRTVTSTVKKSPASATKTSTSSPLAKKTASSPKVVAVKKTTTTTITEKKIVNGNVVQDETKTETFEQVLNEKNAINGFKDDGSEKVEENGQVNTNLIIIDSTTD